MVWTVKGLPCGLVAVLNDAGMQIALSCGCHHRVWDVLQASRLDLARGVERDWIRTCWSETLCGPEPRRVQPRSLLLSRGGLSIAHLSVQLNHPARELTSRRPCPDRSPHFSDRRYTGIQFASAISSRHPHRC